MEVGSFFGGNALAAVDAAGNDNVPAIELPSVDRNVRPSASAKLCSIPAGAAYGAEPVYR